MFVCDCCGETREELKTSKNWSDCCGAPVCEEVEDDDCSCGGTYVVAEECPICGEYMPEDNVVCDECAEKGATVENAIEYGAENTASIEINSFLASMFDTETIERILTEVMQNSAEKEIKAESYCFEDDSAYREFLRAKAEKKGFDLGGANGKSY